MSTEDLERLQREEAGYRPALEEDGRVPAAARLTIKGENHD